MIVFWQIKGKGICILKYFVGYLKNTVIISKYDFNKLKKLYTLDNDIQGENFVDLVKYMCDVVELVGLNNFE